jgi:hypothetical protein
MEDKKRNYLRRRAQRMALSHYNLGDSIEEKLLMCPARRDETRANLLETLGSLLNLSNHPAKL